MMLNLKFCSLTLISIGLSLLNAIATPVTAGELAALNDRAELNPGLKMNIGLQPILPAPRVSQSLYQRNTIAQSTPGERQPMGMGVTARVGTLGLGVDVAKSLSSHIDGRVGFNFGSIGSSRTDSGISYDATLNLSSVHLFGDFYPFGSGFRVTGGLLSQANKVSVNSKPSANGTYTINNTTYSANDVGTLSGDFKYANSIAPYLGIGFGKPATEGLGFNADLGVMFTGAPKVSLNASNPLFNNNPITRAEIDSQVRQTENDLKGFNVYPVLSVGVSYGF